MEIEIKRMWASPSTLHLQCVVWGRGKGWLRFLNVHVPLDEIPRDVVRAIIAKQGDDAPLPSEEDVPLF